jgi:hypothetical protein
MEVLGVMAGVAVGVVGSLLSVIERSGVALVCAISRPQFVLRFDFNSYFFSLSNTASMKILNFDCFISNSLESSYIL